MRDAARLAALVLPLLVVVEVPPGGVAVERLGGQDGQQAEKPPERPAEAEQFDRLDKYVRDAIERQPVVRGQAANRLVQAGRPGLEAILRHVARTATATLSTELVQALGQFTEPQARSLLRQLVEDAGFPWRPQALQALAAQPRADEQPIFESYAAHPSWLMRRAALAGLAKLPAGPAALEKGIADGDLRVRVHAAALTLASGNQRGVPVLLDGLDAEDDFFGEDLGLAARRQAIDALRPLAKEDFGYSPQLDREWREAARKRLAEKLGVSPAGAGGPRTARSWVLGFERRSCQHGDLYLRIDQEGKLWSGPFTPVEVAAEAERLAKVRELSRPAVARRVYGRLACDYFRFGGLGGDGQGTVRCAPTDVPPELQPLLDAWMALASHAQVVSR